MSKFIRKTLSLALVLGVGVFIGYNLLSKDNDRLENEVNIENEVNVENEENKKDEIEKVESIDDQDEEEVVEEEKEDLEEEIEDIKPALPEKSEYIGKLNSLSKTLETTLKDKYSGSTVDMLDAFNTELNEWDALMNETLEIIINSKSEEEARDIKAEQSKWNEDMNEKAEAAALESKGGSMENLNRISSKASTTKERCFELVNKYLK